MRKTAPHNCFLTLADGRGRSALVGFMVLVLLTNLKRFVYLFFRTIFDRCQIGTLQAVKSMLKVLSGAFEM